MSRWFLSRMKSIPKRMVAIALIAVLLSSIRSYLIFSPVTGKIGVIAISGAIVEMEARDSLLDLVHYAEWEEIRGVVLMIDSGGGSASYVEDIYGSLLKLREKKPVVASIVGVGASGAYHIAVASNHIYTESTAFVGNVGVVGSLPQKAQPSEATIETGPYKLQGMSMKDFPLKIQMAFNSFADAVLTQRGERLKIDRRELSKGLIYIGDEAVELGLVDEVGSSRDAAQKAAVLAGLLSYQVVKLNKLLDNSSSRFSSKREVTKNLDWINPPPAIYYMYLPSLADSSKEYFRTYSNSTANTRSEDFSADDIRGTILIDESHHNAFYRGELGILLEEAASNGYRVSYSNSRNALIEKLPRSKALVIINPYDPFLEGEVGAIRSFIKRGGKLLLIAEVTRTAMSSMNTLSGEFSMIFSEGHLYNLDENFGNYRNIIITDFAEDSVTKDLKKLILYTATSVKGKGTSLANTDHKTVYSESEISEEYTVIASNKNIIAIGDFTFITEPFCYSEDNRKLVTNMIKYLTQ